MLTVNKTLEIGINLQGREVPQLHQKYKEETNDREGGGEAVEDFESEEMREAGT
jgi:hypothetical protein